MKQTSFSTAKYIRTRNPKVTAVAIVLAIVMIPFLVRYTLLHASSRMKPEGNKDITFFNGKEWVEAKLVKDKNDTTKGPKKLYFFNGTKWVDAGVDESSTDATTFPVVDISKPQGADNVADKTPENNVDQSGTASTTPITAAPAAQTQPTEPIVAPSNPANNTNDNVVIADNNQSVTTNNKTVTAKTKEGPVAKGETKEVATPPNSNQLQAEALIAETTKPASISTKKTKSHRPLSYSTTMPAPEPDSGIGKFINQALKAADQAKKVEKQPEIPKEVTNNIKTVTGGNVNIKPDGKMGKAEPTPMQKFLTTPFDTAAEKKQLAKDKGEKLPKEDKKFGFPGAPSAPSAPVISADSLKRYIDQQIATALELNAKPVEPVVAQVDSTAFKKAQEEMKKEMEEQKKVKADLDAQVSVQQEKMKDARLNAQPGLRDTVKNEDGKTAVVREEKLALSKQVFAWCPYWMGDAYKKYDFGLMSTVAYYGYEVDANTGGYASIHDWKTTDLIDLAQKKNCKVVLTAALIGEANISKLLANKNACRALIDSLRTLVILRNGNGVNIDFEGLNTRYKTDFSDFVNALSKSLRAVNPNYQVSITLPAVDVEDAYDVAAMDANVDQFIMMGYDYSSSYSVSVGATSPLGAFSGNSLSSCIDVWLSKKMPPAKLILGLPYYGVVWQVDGDKAPARMVKFVGHATFDEIKQKYAGTDPDFYEASLTPYYHGPVAGTGNYEQVWFENEHSLNLKYDLVESKKLGGIGMWALGMDGDSKGIWNMIETKFVKLEKVPVETIKLEDKSAKKSSSGLARWFKRKLNRLYGILRRPSTFNPNKSGLDNFLKIFMVLGGVTFLVTRFMFIYRRLQMGDKWKGQNYFVYLMLFGIGLFTVCLLLYAYITMFFQKMFHSKGFLFSIGLIVGIIMCLIFVLYIIPKLLRTKDLP